VYTKNLFYRFSKEFEKTTEYDVKPEGQFQCWLVPNNIFVYGYGKRTYLVTAVEDEESYLIEMDALLPYNQGDDKIGCEGYSSMVHIEKMDTRSSS
jgi:hypothetical protein